MIESLLSKFPTKTCAEEASSVEKTSGQGKTKRRRHAGKNDIKATVDLEEKLTDIVGVNLTSITGLGPNIILQIISEVGTDMSKFPTAKHFTAYLGFVPRNKITGGVIISSKTDRTQAFKKIIPSISRGDSALAGFYHRIAARSGTGKAIVATCRKLSIAFYNTIVFGKEYVEEGDKRHKEKLANREKVLLTKLAKKHNITLVPTSA